MDHTFKKSVIEKLGLPALWDIVKANPDKPWNYYCLSRNPNITWDIVQANPDKPWNYEWLSINPNITWDIVKANPDKPWDYFDLSKNEMYYNDVVFTRLYRKLLLPILDEVQQLIPDLANIVTSYI